MPVSKKTTAENKKTVKKAAPKVVKETKPEKAKPRKAEAAPIQEEMPEVSLQSDFESIEDFPEEILKANGERSKYIEAIGRRKTSTARVRLYTQGRKGITINNKPYTEYFPKFLHKTIEDSLEKLKCLGKFGTTAVVRGGGLSGQAEAIRHGLARTLVILNPYFKKRLKKSGYLTRDPRMRERKKPGLKRARRAPQWSKR